MSTDINANSPVKVRSLEIHSDGLTFCEKSPTTTKRRVTFSQIQYVLLSSQDVLSFQVGAEVFSVPLKLDSDRQKKALESLLGKLRAYPG